MSLKAVFFGFRGVIFQGYSLQRDLLAELLQAEGLPLGDFPQEYGKFCLGRSDRVAIAALWRRRGYGATGASFEDRVARHTAAYLERLSALESPPIYPGVVEAVNQLWTAGLRLGIVTGMARAAVECVLERARLQLAFEEIVTGDDLDLAASKPEPASYLQGITRVAARHPEMNLQAANCLAIESNYIGIAAARAAGLSVASVANLYPLHLLQRRADWAIDDLRQLEIERIGRILAQKQ